MNMIILEADISLLDKNVILFMKVFLWSHGCES